MYSCFFIFLFTGYVFAKNRKIELGADVQIS